MKRFLTTTLIILFTISGFCNDIADSLKNVIKTSNDKDVIISTTLQFQNYTFRDYPDSSLYFALKIEPWLTNYKDIKTSAEMYAWIGYLYGIQGKNSKAIIYNKKALKLYEKIGQEDVDRQALMNNNLTENYADIG